MLKDNLKRLRQAAGFTQASLATAVGLPLRTVQNWEQGHREPGVPALKSLAAVLSVSLDELLAEPPVEEASGSRDRPRKREAKQVEPEPPAKNGRKRKGG